MARNGASHKEERGRKQMIMREGDEEEKEGVTEYSERRQRSRELCRESKQVGREGTRAIQRKSECLCGKRERARVSVMSVPIKMQSSSNSNQQAACLQASTNQILACMPV